MEAKNIDEIQKLVESIKAKRKNVQEEVTKLEADDIEPSEVLRYVNRLIAENWNLNREVSKFIKALEEASKSEERETKLITDVLTELLSSQRELVNLTEDAVERLKKFVTENPKESVDEIKNQIEFLKSQIKYYNHDYIEPSLTNLVNAIEDIHKELNEFYKKFEDDNGKLRLELKTNLETNLNLLEKLADDTSQLLSSLKSENVEVLENVKNTVDIISKKIDDVIEESKVLRLKLENKKGDVILSLPDLDEIQKNMYKYTQSLSQFIGYTNSRLEQIQSILGRPGNKTLEEIINDLNKMIEDEKIKEGEFLNELSQMTNRVVEELDKSRADLVSEVGRIVRESMESQKNEILDKLDIYSKLYEELDQTTDIKEVSRIENEFKKTKAYELYLKIQEKKKKKSGGFRLPQFHMPKKKVEIVPKSAITVGNRKHSLSEILQEMKPGEEKMVEDIAKNIGKSVDEVIKEFTELPMDVKQGFELRDYGLEADLQGKKPKLVRK